MNYMLYTQMLFLIIGSVIVMRDVCSPYKEHVPASSVVRW